MNPTVSLVLGGLLLLAAGIVVGFLAGRSKARRDVSEETSRLRAEQDAYRRKVTEHFRETAGHFQALGEQYRDLYRHLASGAEALCDTTDDTGRLEFRPPPELVHDKSDAAGTRSPQGETPATGEAAKAGPARQEAAAVAGVPGAGPSPDTTGESAGTGDEELPAGGSGPGGEEEEKTRGVGAGAGPSDPAHDASGEDGPEKARQRVTTPADGEDAPAGGTEPGASGEPSGEKKPSDKPAGASA